MALVINFFLSTSGRFKRITRYKYNNEKKTISDKPACEIGIKHYRHANHVGLLKLVPKEISESEQSLIYL